MNWPTSCRNLVRFSAATPEFTRLECVYRVGESSKSGITHSQLSQQILNLCQVFMIGRNMGVTLFSEHSRTLLYCDKLSFGTNSKIDIYHLHCLRWRSITNSTFTFTFSNVHGKILQWDRHSWSLRLSLGPRFRIQSKTNR